MLRPDHVPICENRSTVNDILQLSYITGPLITKKLLERFSRELLRLLAAGNISQELLHQYGDISLPVSKGRDRQRDRVQPEQQFIEKPMRVDLALQVTCGEAMTLTSDRRTRFPPTRRNSPV